MIFFERTALDLSDEVGRRFRLRVQRLNSRRTSQKTSSAGSNDHGDQFHKIASASV